MTALLALVLLLVGSGPVVDKVEPPSWWAGHSLNPVRVLVRGRSLAGARVEGAAGITPGPASVSASGTSLFVDLTLAADAAPGPRRLRLATARGEVAVPFDVLAPLPRVGRFQGFSPDDVIYVAMPDRFANGNPANDDPPASRGLHDRSNPRYYHGGDLQGVIDRLPYLQDLGVTALWLNPLYDNANRLNERETYEGRPIADYHGYGAVDFYAVEEHLGDLAKVTELADAAHRLGIKLIQDQVANHTGPYHPWVHDPPTPTWFNGSAQRHLKNSWQTWTIMDPHASAETRRKTLDGWFIDLLPDLNQDDHEVRRYLIQNSLWWLGTTGMDAVRQDTLPYVPRGYWAEWTAALKREHPALRVLGEMWDDDPALVSFFQGGAACDGVDTGVDALFDFPLFSAARRAFASGKPVRELAQVLARDRLYPDPSQLVTFLGLHDVPRFMSETGATPAGLELGMTFLFTTRGVPLVYYGDEIGLPGGGDPDNRRDFPGGWPEDARSAFERAGRTPAEQRLFEHVRRLARLRSELPALRRGRLVNLRVEEQLYAYARVLEGAAPVIVVLNNAAAPASVDLPTEGTGLATGTTLGDRLGALAEVAVEAGRLRLTLPGRGALVLTPR